MAVYEPDYKCTCGQHEPGKECHAGIQLSDGRERIIWLHDQKGNETSMYVDANTIVRLIEGLRKMLTEMTEPKLS